MSAITVNVEHDGVTYAGAIATIRSTYLGREDHGIWSFMIHTEWPGGGVGVGGYALDTPERDDGGKHLGRVGTAYGLDVLMRVCETVGVDAWEHLPGKQVIVLYEDYAGPGAVSVGLAGTTTGEVLVLKKHAAQWLERAGGDA